MIHTLRLVLADEHGALLRVLGLVERRGHALCGVDLWRSKSDRKLYLELQIDPGKASIENLARQLQKLHQVRIIESTEGRGVASEPDGIVN